MTRNPKRRLPAEWEEQDAVLLAWPHPRTDWAEQLDAVQQTYREIISAISRHQRVILIVPTEVAPASLLCADGTGLDRVSCYALPCNDTWARDFGPLAVETGRGIELQDFTFNGWGNKFCASLDNRLTRALSARGAFGTTDVQTIDLVLEGGSIESDGAGTLLTTRDCLLEKHRNPQFSQAEIEEKLKDIFGAQRILWLEAGALEGDDTDSHIDTLARFAPANTIVFQGCNDPGDRHFAELAAMRKQLSHFVTADGAPYRLLELPWPAACYAAAGQRLPASYANFLIINRAVLVPTYADPADAAALAVIGQAFPHREIIPIDCRSLIEQHGSLHCLTMQLPKGVLTCA